MGSLNPTIVPAHTVEVPTTINFPTWKSAKEYNIKVTDNFQVVEKLNGNDADFCPVSSIPQAAYDALLPNQSFRLLVRAELYVYTAPVEV